MVNWPLALLKDEIMVAQRLAAVPARTSRARNMRSAHILLHIHVVQARWARVKVRHARVR